MPGFQSRRGDPYPDERFDGVISMDFFGHVEFRFKDAIILEISRVTRHGGCGQHSAETGFIDYFNSDPTNPDDLIRRYVHVDGHIGVEPAACLKKRFASCFSRVETNVTYLHPFYDIDNLKNVYGNIFDEEFASVLRKFTHPEASQMARVILGRFNRYFIDLYQDVFGASFQPDDDPVSHPSESLSKVIPRRGILFVYPGEVAENFQSPWAVSYRTMAVAKTIWLGKIFDLRAPGAAIKESGLTKTEIS